MSVEQQATRVASGAKSALKALIQKLGGTVPDSTKIDGLATIVDSIDLGDKFMLIPANPTTHDILWYDENTESWVLANLNPTTIGAAASGHTHTKAAITDFPTSMTPTAHKASHKTGGSDAIAPADIGAAAASHTHTKSQITDFPSSMTPTAHAATHKTGGSDAITPGDIDAYTKAETDAAIAVRASTSVYGTTKLSNSTTSSSKTLAATPYAVRAALNSAKAYTDSAIAVAIQSAY